MLCSLRMKDFIESILTCAAADNTAHDPIISSSPRDLHRSF
jgi:hypothetical protein